MLWCWFPWLAARKPNRLLVVVWRNSSQPARLWFTRIPSFLHTSMLAKAARLSAARLTLCTRSPIALAWRPSWFRRNSTALSALSRLARRIWAPVASRSTTNARKKSISAIPSSCRSSTWSFPKTARSPRSRTLLERRSPARTEPRDS